jgi:hypothetical protein
MLNPTITILYMFNDQLQTLACQQGVLNYDLVNLAHEKCES